MSPQPTMKLTGMEGLSKQFSAVVKAVGKKPLLKAVQRAADEIVEEAQRRAPVESGDLKRDIRAMKAKSTAKTARIKIGNTKTIFYAHMQEFGTVHHAAQPYLRPAFDTKKAKAAQGIGEDFWSDIETVAAKGFYVG